MKMQVVTKVNDRQEVTTEIEGDMMTCLSGANALLAYDGKCGQCGSKDVSLQYSTAKGYKFAKFICNECNSRAPWGEYKEGGYFLKQWETFNPERSTINANQGGYTTVESEAAPF